MIDPDSPETRVRFIEYDSDQIREGIVSRIEDIPPRQGSSTIVWVDVQGFANESLLREIADRFGLHPLAFEDLINVPQVPKSETYDQQQLIIAKVVRKSIQGIDISQVGMVLGKQFVLTFRPEHSALLEPVAHRLELPTSRLRQHESDYLAYVILDTAVDSYYPVLEALVGSIDDLENRTLADPKPQLLFEINEMKNQLSNLRRSIWPQRESLQSLIRGDSELFSEHVQLFLRDTADHCVQATDVIEMYRERSTGLLQTYLSAVAHRTNEIMKFLTVVSSIFVPLTFVAGIYGMNFPNIPEFSMPGAYFVFWVLILALAASMIWFFIRNGWIRPSFLNEKAPPSLWKSSPAEGIPESTVYPASAPTANPNIHRQKKAA